MLGAGSPRGKRSGVHVGPLLQGAPQLSVEEKGQLQFLLNDPLTLEYTVVSPRFTEAERNSFAAPFKAALPILKDAYLAYAGALKSLHSDYASEEDDPKNLRYATNAMATLRGLPVTNAGDAELCLALGYTLSLCVYAVIGVGVSDVCHYCLTITKPFMGVPNIGSDAQLRIRLLVLLETMECIVHRQKPTLRLETSVPESLDRHLGLSIPLLPYYHDICAISHSLVDGNNETPRGLFYLQLDDIQTHLRNWMPSPTMAFIHEVSTTEAVHLLAQAKAFRLGGLLLVHRLKHPFGREDEQADLWSREVMMELKLAQSLSNTPTRFVTMPFILAAVEVRDPDEREKALGNVDKYVDQFTPAVQKATKTFLTRIWHERDAHMVYSWFDSVHKPCVVLDAVGSQFSI